MNPTMGNDTRTVVAQNEPPCSAFEEHEILELGFKYAVKGHWCRGTTRSSRPMKHMNVEYHGSRQLCRCEMDIDL